MDVTTLHQVLDLHSLTGAIRCAIGSPTLEIISWESAPLGPRSGGFATAGLWHISGTARDHGTVIPWSVVLKILQPPADDGSSSQHDDVTHYLYWKREQLLYESEILDDLPDGLAIPHCYQVSERPDGTVWLWLEEITDTYDSTWPLDRYRLAARHFGRLNGVYLTGRALPTVPWLSHRLERQWIADFTPLITEVLESFQGARIWDHPALARVFPVLSLDPFLSIWDNRTQFLAALDQLPQTFCHYDAMRPNLFARRRRDGQEQTVAIDWAYAGTGGVGVELAELVIGSLLFLTVAATDAEQLDTLAFTGYIEGLRDAGWQGKPQTVRLGYLTSALLRLGPAAFHLLQATLDADSQERMEQAWRCPITALTEQWASVTALMLRMADETWTLLDRLE